MLKERKIILFGEDLKKPMRLAVRAAEKLSVAAILFGNESAELTAELNKHEGELDLIIVHVSGGLPAEIKILAELTAAETKCDIKIRSILAGKARTNLSALIGIRKRADEATAKLFAEAMLFGAEAGIDFTPSMEVETKNVTASHGATIETIDPEKNFYLGSRGMNEDEIRQTLAEAFLSPLYELTDHAAADKVANKLKSILGK